MNQAEAKWHQNRNETNTCTYTVCSCECMYVCMHTCVYSLYTFICGLVVQTDKLKTQLIVDRDVCERLCIESLNVRVRIILFFLLFLCSLLLLLLLLSSIERERVSRGVCMSVSSRLAFISTNSSIPFRISGDFIKETPK